jgi:hypothetical protein
LVVLGKEVTKTPPAETPTAITSDPTRGLFVNCVGALDGIHFLARVPEGRPTLPFRNRRGELTMNVLAAVDFKMRFTYMLSGWEGSANDSMVIKNAVYEHGFRPPPGCYYLADVDYTNSSMWLRPYRGVRYPRETTAPEWIPENKYELFNNLHGTLRAVVDRTTRMFKRRWRIFDRAPEVEYDTLIKLVYALAAIHNFISIEEDVDGDHDFNRLRPALHEKRDQKRKHQKQPRHVAGMKKKPESGMDKDRDTIAEEPWVAYQARKAANLS